MYRSIGHVIYTLCTEPYFLYSLGVQACRAQSYIVFVLIFIIMGTSTYLEAL